LPWQTRAKQAKAEGKGDKQESMGYWDLHFIHTSVPRISKLRFKQNQVKDPGKRNRKQKNSISKNKKHNIDPVGMK